MRSAWSRGNSSRRARASRVARRTGGRREEAGPGGEAAAVACNIAEEAECRRLVDEARATYGPCDVLVNNAALTYRIPVVDYPVNRLQNSMAVSFHAPFILSQAVLPEMIARRAGA